MVNEFGDVDLPNLNSITNSSSDFTTISAQTYNGSDPSNNFNTNMNLNLNWAATATSEVPSLPSHPWPNPNLSFSGNALLLKALQLRSYQQREAAATDHFATYNINPQGFSHLIGTDLNPNLSAASSKVLECMPQQQEQPFNVDSIW